MSKTILPPVPRQHQEIVQIGYQSNPLRPVHSHNWQADCREGPRSRTEWEPTELKTSALPPEPGEPSVTLAKGT